MIEAEENTGIDLVSLKNIEIEDYKKLHPDSFPYWVFPKPIQSIIEDGNKSLGFPIDFFSASIFFACGLANGLSTKIEISKSWEETTVMYMALVGRAGTNKSHPLSFALKPIIERDALNYNLYEQELRDYEEATEDKGVKPRWQKTIVQDITVEAVAETHDHNKRGLGVYAEELNSWLKNMGRYNKGSDLEFWLSSWSGKPIIVDRKGSKSINIPQAFISVIGTIQNDILLDIIGGKNSKNGFADRVLFVIPENLKKQYWNDNEISDESIENYAKIIKSIMNQSVRYDEYDRVKPNVIRYTKEAKALVKEWQRNNTDKYNNQIHNAMDGYYSKIETYISRFALTLQVMKDACESFTPNKVERFAVEGAIEIASYFILQANKVGVQNRKQSLLNDNKQRKDFYDDLPLEFETNQAIQIGTTKPYNFNSRTIERLLKKPELFIKVKRGKYRKT